MRHLRLLSIAAVCGVVFTLAPLTGQEHQAQATTPVACATFHHPLTAPALITGGVFKDSYEIASAKDLVYLSMNFKENVGGGVSGKWLEKHFVQTAPIDLGGCLFTPIGGFMGEGEERFTGKYISVSGSSITGLTINTVVEGAGLFGETSGAEISGVVLKDVQVNGTRSVGGLVGYARTTTISDSSVIGSVSGTEPNVGGLVGGVANNSTVSSSFSDAVVSGNGSGDSVGGLVGGLFTSSTINDSYARGSVSRANRIGGLVGEMDGTTTAINRSYSTASISEAGSLRGGLVGNLNTGANAVQVTNSFWDIDASGLNTSMAGFGKTLADMKLFTTFDGAGWKISDGWEEYAPDDDKVWGIRADLNDGYPFLLWEYSLDRPLCPTPNEAGVHEIGHEFHLIAVGSGGADGPCGLDDDYRQTADIDISAIDSWTPIGDWDNPFTGRFDGDGHTISNLTITSGANYRGLFGVVDLPVGADPERVAIIDDVHLDSLTITFTTSAEWIGGLVGYNGGTIRGSSVTGTITVGAAGQKVGGLAGANVGQVVESSAALNPVLVGRDTVGGLVGLNTGNTAEISESHTEGTIRGVNEVGGLVGRNQGGATIVGSHSESLVEGDSDVGSSTGGLVGVNTGANTTVRASYATKNVVGRDFVGGLVGLNQEQATISLSFAEGNVTGAATQAKVGGLVGHNQVSGQVTESFATGDVTASGSNSTAGGLVGSNVTSAKVSNSYATGTASATGQSSSAGGLVGLNALDAEISTSYSTGEATAILTGAVSGGLVGTNSAIVANSFYDSDLTTNSDTGKGTPKTTAQMTQLSTFSDASWSIADCTRSDDPTVWGINATINQGYPFLIALEESSLPACPTSPAPNTTSSQSSSGNATLEAEAEDTLTQTPFSGFRQPPTTTPDTDTPTPVIPESDTGSQDSSESPTADSLGGGDSTQDATTPPTSPSGLGTWWLWGIGLGGLGAAALIAGGVAWARGRV